jgi:hypothetical protein
VSTRELRSGSPFNNHATVEKPQYISVTCDKICSMRRLPRAFSTLMPAADLLILCFTLSCVTLASGSPEQAGRPRITGIDHVTIYVSDIEKSRRFYSHVLGLTVGCRQYSGLETCFLIRPSEQRILLK